MAYGVLALRASGERAISKLVQESAEWLARQQHRDDQRREDYGGFGLDQNSAVDITGAALSAFGAAGDANGPVAEEAVAFLKREQERDSGGFGYYGRASSANAGSTAWAVQGLVATGHGGGRTVGKALSYLRLNPGARRWQRSSHFRGW